MEAIKEQTVSFSSFEYRAYMVGAYEKFTAETETKAIG